MMIKAELTSKAEEEEKAKRLKERQRPVMSANLAHLQYQDQFLGLLNIFDETDSSPTGRALPCPVSPPGHSGLKEIGTEEEEDFS